jgi:hypothetical protein
LFGEVPSLTHLRVFGSRVFYHIPSELRNKLQPKSKEGTFVGYDQLNRAYRIIPKENPRKVILSRDVIFDELTITNKSLCSPFLDKKTEDMVENISNYVDKAFEPEESSTNIGQTLPLLIQRLREFNHNSRNQIKI